MSYNEVLEKNNFKESYYDDIFCPFPEDIDKYKEFKDMNYEGNNKKINITSSDKNKKCSELCDTKNECKGYSQSKSTKKCTYYGSFPKSGELKLNNDSDFYLKKNINYNFNNFNNNKIKDSRIINRIRNYCLKKNVRHYYEKRHSQKIPGLEKCVNKITVSDFDPTRGGGYTDYIDLNKSCVWETLNLPNTEVNNQIKFINKDNLGDIIKSKKLDEYSMDWSGFSNSKEKYNEKEKVLSDFDKQEYFPEYYKLLDETYGKVDNKEYSGIEKFEIHEDFATTKTGSKREKLPAVKDFGCNNIIFMLLIIPVALIIYYFVYSVQKGKNKNL